MSPSSRLKERGLLCGDLLQINVIRLTNRRIALLIETTDLTDETYMSCSIQLKDEALTTRMGIGALL